MLYSAPNVIPYRFPVGSKAMSVITAPMVPTMVTVPVATSTLPNLPAASSTHSRVGQTTTP